MRLPKFKINQRVWFVSGSEAKTGLVTEVNMLYRRSEAGEFQQIEYGVDSEPHILIVEQYLFSDYEKFRDHIREKHDKRTSKLMADLGRLHPEMLGKNENNSNN